MKRHLVLSATIIFLMGAFVFLFFTSHVNAADCTDSEGCTNPIDVTIKINFEDAGSAPTCSANGDCVTGSSPTPISDASTVPPPASVPVTLIDEGTGFNGTNDAVMESAIATDPTVSGEYATYKVTLPEYDLTNNDQDDYSAINGHGPMEACVSADILNTQTDANCATVIPNDSDDANPNQTISVSISGTNIVSATTVVGPGESGDIPAGCEGSTVSGSLAPGTTCPSTTYPPGCYALAPTQTGAADPQEACPSGATDSDGNPLSSSSCYIGGAVLQDVSCSNLSTPITVASSTSTATQQQSIALDCSVTLNPLTWLICPIVSAADTLIGEVDTQITSLLDINGCSYFNATGAGADTINTDTSTGKACANAGSTSPSQGYYDAWQSLRNIAIGIVVIAALVMVISQALGFEVFDAYTIKKVLPRMVVAVIAIALSWQLVQVLIQISDDIGIGVRWLIYEPFVQFGNINISSSGSSALGLIGGVALLGLNLIGLLSFVLTAAVAVIVAFSLLIFREMFVIFLAIFVPVAIACFIMPGTEKVWKFWWTNFSKALIMFPLIAGMIAIGRVFAVTLVGNSQDPGVVAEISAMVAYFGPYFLIPFTFRMAGTVLASAGSLASGVQKSINKPIGQYRRRRLGENAKKLKEGERFHGRDYIPGTNRIAGRLNAVTRGAGHGFGGNFGLGVRGNAADNQATLKRGAEVMKTENFQSISNDEEALRALTFGTAAEAKQSLIDRYKASGKSDAEADTMATRAVRAAQASGFGFGDKGASYAAAQQLVNTGTGYKDMPDMVDTLDRAAFGNSSTKTSLAGFANSTAKQTGRYDLAPGFGELNGLVNSSKRTQADFDAAIVSAVRGAEPITGLRGKPQQVTNLMEGLTRHLDANTRALKADPRNVHAKNEVVKTLGQMFQYDTQKGYASPLNQATVNEMTAKSFENKTYVENLIKGDPGWQKAYEEAKAPQRLDPRNIAGTPGGPDPGGPDAGVPPPAV